MSRLKTRKRKNKININIKVYRTLIYWIGHTICIVAKWIIDNVAVKLMIKGIKTRATIA